MTDICEKCIYGGACALQPRAQCLFFIEKNEPDDELLKEALKEG